MKAVYANECRFAAGTDHGEVLAEVWDWLASGRLAIPAPTTSAGSSGSLHGADGAEGSWRWTSVGDRSSVAVDITQQDSSGGGWRTRAWVVDDAGEVRTSVLTGPVLAAGVLTVANYRGFRPGVVERWLNRFEVIADGTRLRDTLLRVGPAEASALATFIQNRDRRRPIVALTAEPDTGSLLVDEGYIIRRLGGLAHLVVVEPSATWTLTNALGKAYSVFDGAMRIWWPGFSTDDPPPRHRRWLPWHLLDEERDCEAELARLVWRVAVDVFGPPAIDGELLAIERDAEVAARVDRARQSADSVPAEWLEDYERTLRDLQVLNEELQIAQADATNLRSELEELHNTDTTATSEDDQEATSIEDAVRIAATEAENVIYLAEAYESARESEYANPAHVLADLRVLNRVAAAWSSGDLPPSGFRGAFDAEPVRFQPGISPTARQQYASDYEITYADEKVMMGPHLRRGVGPPVRIMRIYWYVDEANRRLVVGHVGRKLRDDSNS